jgi:hypothetical protein
MALELKDDQRGRIDALRKDAAGKLGTILSEGQRKQLLDRRRADPFGSSRIATAGQLIPLTERVTLRLSAEQRKGLAALRADVDARLGEILNAGQKHRLKEIRELSVRGGPSGVGGPPGGGPPGFGPPGGGQIFHAYRYAPDYPGLAGKELTPGGTIVEPERANSASR